MLTMTKDSTQGKPNGGESPLFSAVHQTDARRGRAWLSDRLRAGKVAVYSEVITLTPTLAEILLERNPDNRTLKKARLADYVEDIRNGNWSLNGESLKISVDGFLNDGQHRCHAVILAGRPIRTQITFGLERDTRMTLDQGAARRPGDYLSMDGIAYGHLAAAVAGMIWQVQTRGFVSSECRHRPTHIQITDCYRDHPEIADSIRVANRKGSRGIGGVAPLAFCHWLFAQKDAGTADAFVDRLLKGDRLTTNDPIYLCRERLRSERKMRVQEKVELIIRAWNLHRKGKRQTKIQLSGTLPAVEG